MEIHLWEALENERVKLNRFDPVNGEGNDFFVVGVVWRLNHQELITTIHDGPWLGCIVAHVGANHKSIRQRSSGNSDRTRVNDRCWQPTLC